MPKKIVKKEKKAKDTLTYENFDLDLTTKDKALQMKGYMGQLINVAGWIALVKIMEGNIAVLDKQIISKIHIEESRELTDKEVDELRYKRQYIEVLINMPKKLIKDCTPSEVIPPDSGDPYATDMS